MILIIVDWVAVAVFADPEGPCATSTSISYQGLSKGLSRLTLAHRICVCNLKCLTELTSYSARVQVI